MILTIITKRLVFMVVEESSFLKYNNQIKKFLNIKMGHFYYERITDESWSYFYGSSFIFVQVLDKRFESK